MKSMENRAQLFAVFQPEKGKNTVLLNWYFSSTRETFKNFVIVKSHDDREFEIIGKEQRISGKEREFAYLFIDENIICGKNHYRICYITKGKYSKLVPLSDTVTVTVDKIVHQPRKAESGPVNTVAVSEKKLELVID